MKIRRPLCTGLLLFLAVYLGIVLGLPEITGSGPAKDRADQGSVRDENGQASPEQGGWDVWSGRQVVLVGNATGLYQPADGSQENMSFILRQISMLTDSEEAISWESPQLNHDYKINIEQDAVLCYLKGGGEGLPAVGSFVKVSGILTPFLEATNPGEFDAAAYYEGQGYLFSLRKAELLAQSEEYDKIRNFLYQLQYGAAVFLRETLGEKDGALAAAMVLGRKREIDAKIKELYQDAGIAHLLAISGLHITFIGMAVFYLLRRIRMPLWAASAFSFLLLLLYGEMAGMSVSTRRAVIMFFFLVLAKVCGRTSDIPTSLAAAACVILTGNPRYLLDAGFGLSFLAVAGAATAVPMLQDRGIAGSRRADGRWRKWKEKAFRGLTSGVGITLVMLPVMLLHFYKWNPWSLLANLIVIPLMGVLLPYLLLFVAAGWTFGRIAGAMSVFKLLALPATGIFFLYEKICQAVLLLPGSSLHTGSPAWWQILVFGLGLAALLAWGKKLPPMPRLLTALLLTLVFMIRPPGQLQITMVDVGQGECLYVETPGHHAYLLDAGSSSKSETGQYQIIPFLEYSGVRKLEGIFITHWDEDHVNALEDILDWAKRDHVKIGRIFLPDTALQDEMRTKLLALAGRYGIGVEFVCAGQSLQDGKVKLECLHPYAGEYAAERNESSLVIKLTYENFSALFTGDLEENGEEWLLRNYGEEMLDCDLLDAGHHGSATSSSEAFLRAVSPRAVLISCGKNNSYGHPAPQTLERLEKLGIPYYVTAKSGAVTVRVDDAQMRIETFSE
ncbi:MAG: DNA internalization-related competence protein ComEC/Rec2 [Eubacteriales bacterium]|nr:DNA internalization-related competence protein ComEC/Rec2 [Eubacteriales bacterium]